MSDRPTPETDLEHKQFSMGGFTLDFCRKLERERDKAQEDATNYYAKIGELERERDEARESAERYRLEANAMMMQRDELRADQDIARFSDKAHDRLVGELVQALKERDEARDAAAKWESSFDAMERAGAEQASRADENREWALRAERERDEARDKAEKSKAYKRVLKETNAQLKRERDEALNKMADALQEVDLRTLDFERMKQERDEARVVTGETSDGYHTFNELYEHRCTLFLALMGSNPGMSWIAMKHFDGSAFEGWFVAGMELPTGDVTYHLPDSMWEMAVATGARIGDRGKEWDGHSAGDVVRRIQDWAVRRGCIAVEWEEMKEKLADALQEVDLRTLDYERMKQGRDEARKEAEYYRERYEKLKEGK